MISPVCILCEQELTEFGAILLSPPDKHERVKKDHLCDECYQVVRHIIAELGGREQACPSCGGGGGMRPYVACADDYHAPLYVNEDDGFQPSGQSGPS